MEESDSVLIHELIDLCIHKEKENYAINSLEIKKTIHFGLRTLLMSMMDIEKNHVKMLMELRLKPNLTDYFDETQLPEKQDWIALFKDVHFGDAMAYLDFLTMLILREEKMAKLYQLFCEACSDNEMCFHCKTLEEDTRKKRSWALDRYELEILSLRLSF
ncbi:MAG: hypothetical protein JXR70_07370 [Spirochaetales bacterium]|nr:hypothetical protein [Spirochaetales bacterium]